MKDSIDQRFAALLQEGNSLHSRLPKDDEGQISYWIKEDVQEYQEWLASAINLIALVSPPGSTYLEELSRINNQPDQTYDLPSGRFLRIYGILASAAAEWSHGLLRRFEYVVLGGAFADFLDHARSFLGGGQTNEAAILASVVLEDSMKKVALAHKVDPEGKALDLLISELAKAQVLSSVKAKRMRAHAGVRNHALHAEWGKIEARDVDDLIRGVEDLIKDHLS